VLPELFSSEECQGVNGPWSGRLEALINDAHAELRVPSEIKGSASEVRSGTATAVPFQIAFMRQVLEPTVSMVRTYETIDRQY
jgi:hypothetical protein